MSNQLTYAIFIALILIALIQSKGSAERSHASFISDQAIPINLKCFYIDEFSTYSFTNYINYTEEVKYYNPKGILHYNWCNNPKTQCPNPKNSKGALVRKIGSTCERLAGSIEGEYKNENRWEFYSQREGKAETGIKIAFNNGDNCKHPDKGLMKYSVTYYIKCDSKLNQGELKLDYSLLFPEIEICKYTLLGSAKEACPQQNVYPTNAFLIQFNYLFCPILCIAGLFLIFGSFYLPKVQKYIVSSLIVVYIATIIIFVIAGVSALYIGWIIFGIGLALGIGLGFIISKYPTVELTGEGGCLGYVIGVFTYNLILRYVEWYPYVVYSIIVVGLIIIWACVGFFWLQKHISFLCPAFLGSYLLARGISLFAGGFPNEFIIFDLVKFEEWALLREYQTSVVYGYLGGMVVFTCVGLFIKYSFGKEEEQQERAPLL